MSKIEEPIKEQCPNGVKFYNLNEMTSISTGKLNANAMVKDGEYAFFTCDAKPFKIDKYAFDGEAILISGNGSQVGHLNYYFGKFNAYQRTYVLMNFNKKIICKYLYHYLSAFLKQHIDENSKKGSVPYITLPMLQHFRVPLPPIEVQEEIVRILDKFGKLEAELEAELEARRGQYKFWREKLINNGKYKEYNITELCKSISAGGDVPKDTIKGITSPQDKYVYPVISNGVGVNAIYGYSKNYRVDVSSCVTIAARGTIGYHEVRHGKFTPIIRLITLIPNEELITSKYLNYALYGYEFKSEGGSIPQLTTPTIKQLNLLIPPLEEQQRIVDILDKFDMLVNDISEGLPAEIEARRKQYEYYRNKLLSFEEVSCG